MSLDLLELRKEVERRATTINAPKHLLPTYGESEDSARPHLEADEQGYHFVVVERGREVERTTTTDLDELFYLVFQSVTFSMACRFESRHRIAGQDARRLMFQHQLELLGRLAPVWAQRCLEEQKVVLQGSPFID